MAHASSCMHIHTYNNNNDNDNNNKHILTKITYHNKERGVPYFLPQPVCSSRVRRSPNLGREAALTSKCGQKAAGGACAEVREEAASSRQELFKATWHHRILTGYHNTRQNRAKKLCGHNIELLTVESRAKEDCHCFCFGGLETSGAWFWFLMFDLFNLPFFFYLRKWLMYVFHYGPRLTMYQRWPWTSSVFWGERGVSSQGFSA